MSPARHPSWQYPSCKALSLTPHDMVSNTRHPGVAWRATHLPGSLCSAAGYCQKQANKTTVPSVMHAHKGSEPSHSGPAARWAGQALH